MRLALLAAALATGGCTPDRDRGADESEARAAQDRSTKGRVADLAGVLDAAAERRLAEQIEAVRAASGRQLFVATVPVNKGESLEQFGWAVRMPDGVQSLLVDPVAHTVRIEGPLPAEAKGQIVREMRPYLAAGRLEGALGIGIRRLGA